MHRAFFLLCFTATSAALGCSTSAESVGSSESPVSGIPIGDVRGVVDISKSLRSRMLDAADPKTASFDISRVAGPVFNLRKQLGVFATEGTSSTYQGGQPTPLRATLWHQIAGRFAAGIAGVCVDGTTKVTFAAYQEEIPNQGPGGGGPIERDAGADPLRGVFRLRPSVADQIAAVCRFEGDEGAHRRATSSLFDTVMGIGGTLAAERAAFETQFGADGAPAVSASPADRVTSMMIGLLLNPHFLLAK